MASPWACPYKLHGCFGSWSIFGRNYQVSDIPFAHLSGLTCESWTLARNDQGMYVPQSTNSWADFNTIFPALTARRVALGPKFNIFLTIGGHARSSAFSPAMDSLQNRTVLVDEIVRLFKTQSFLNGICLDWRYPSDNGINYGKEDNVVTKRDGSNYLAFLTMLRAGLDLNGLAAKQIAITSSGIPDHIAFPVREIAAIVDEIRLLTLDYACGDSCKVTTHHTNVYPDAATRGSIDECVTAYLARGVPSHKLLIAVAMYSRGFADTHGVSHEASHGSPDTSFDTSMCDYRSLPRPGAVECFDDVTKAGYSYDDTKKIFNSYDTVKSVVAKAEYVAEKKLGGLFAWEIARDFPPDHPRSLTRALHGFFHPSVLPIPLGLVPAKSPNRPRAAPKEHSDKYHITLEFDAKSQQAKIISIAKVVKE